MDNVPNLNVDELSAYASAKHLAGVSDRDIQEDIVQMLRSDGWKDAAIAPMINEIARRTKEARESPKGSPKASQNTTAAMLAALTQLTQMMAPITSRLEALEQRSAQPTPPMPTPESYSDHVTAPTLSEKPQKKRLPDPERFDGSRSNYPGWKYECEGKLQYDLHLFPTEDAKKRYVLSRTRDKANQVLLPWILENRLGSVEEMWQHMDTQFLDVHQQKRSLNRLRHLKQGRRSVRDYVSEFNQLRVESGQEFSGAILREMFSEGLSVELQRLMLRTPKHISFKEYTDEAIEISDDLYRINLHSKPREGPTQYARKPYRQNKQSRTRTPSPPEDMEWEPTKANRASAKEWRLKGNQRECFNCGEAGHFAKNCKKGSKPKGTRVSKVTQREHSHACSCSTKTPDSSDVEDLEDSGKE